MSRLNQPRTVLLVLAILLSGTTAALAAGTIRAPTDSSELGQFQNLVMMVVYATIALVFSFLCSVAEAVVLSVSASYIANLEKTRKRVAGRIKRIKTNIDRSLAAILTLNTIAHTVGAGGAGAEAAAYFGDASVGIAMAILTLLILFLSEIIPKTLGALYWRKLAPLTASFVQWLIWSLLPLILVSERLTKWLSHGKSVHQFSRDEFTALADLGEQGGHLDAKESTILKNLFRLSDLCAEDIMTPRTVVFALQQDRTVSEILKSHEEIGFSRIPIYAADRDEVTGFVLKTEILLNQYRRDGKSKLRDLKRDIRGVQERAPLRRVLEDLLDNRAHILLVVDQYGGMEGIVTLEDLVETLIGIEIVDEEDKIDDMRRLARQKWEARMQSIGIDVLEAENRPPEPKGDPPGPASDSEHRKAP